MSLFGETTRKLEERCGRAENISYFDNSKDDECQFQQGEVCGVTLQDGKEQFTFTRKEEINNFLRIKFEEYGCIEGCMAIYSVGKKEIESLISVVDEYKSTQRVCFSLYTNILSLRKHPWKGDHDSLPNITLKNENNNSERITFGLCSKELDVLTEGKQTITPDYPFISIRLEGFNFDNDDKAKEILEKISGALFYQISKMHDVLFAISGRYFCFSDWDHFTDSFKDKEKTVKKIPPLRFPTNIFTKEVLSLYFHAKGGSPALYKYLSLYRAIEFYFPELSRRKVRDYMSKQGFDIESNEDIDTLLKLSKSNNEIDTLFGILNVCVTDSKLRDFFEFCNRKSFFEKPIPDITQKRIIFNDPKLNLIEEVAQRVYDIRNKIAHGKNLKSGKKPLFPGSEGERILTHDTDLLEFLTKEVIDYYAINSQKNK